MDRTDLSEYLSVARKAAEEAGKFLFEGLERGNNRVEFKGEFDLVTEMDRRSETLIGDFLTRKFPDVSLLAEEGGETGPSSGMRWLVDPLDGTTSYAHGIPHFSVSIALEVEGAVELGVVYNPCLKECFTAIRGCGARLNDRTITVSGTRDLRMSLLATGFPYDRGTSPRNNLDHFCAFMLKIQGIRRMGSAALDLCYTAAGRFDGFWELKLKPWDSAAGMVILEEAGGRVTDFGGGPYSIYGDELLASNGLIHEEMIEVLRGG